MWMGRVNGIVNKSGGVELMGLSIKVEGGVNGIVNQHRPLEVTG